MTKQGLIPYFRDDIRRYFYTYCHVLNPKVMTEVLFYAKIIILKNFHEKYAKMLF